MEKWNVRLKKWVTSKNLAVVLSIVYVISLIPLFVLGQYNYPSADDFTNGSMCHHAWEKSHNIFVVFGAAIDRMIYEWLEWRGCFTSSFLSALTPNFLGEEWYSLTVWLVIGMLTLSTTYLLHIIMTKVFKAEKYSAHCVAMLVLFVTVQCMVEKGRVEAFYWYSGAINYTFVHGISLFFFGIMISAVYETGKRKTVKLIVASILGFLTGGGNQLTALNAVIVMAVVAVILFAMKKWKLYKGFAVPMLFCLIGFGLSIVAPGNSVRASVSNGMNPIKAIVVSFYYCLNYCLNEWTDWPVILVVLMLIPLFWHMARQTQYKFPYPMVVVLFGFCLVSAMMTPPLFATGNIESGRLQAITFMMYILVLSLCVGYVTGWMRKKYENRKEMNEKELKQRKTSTSTEFSINEIWCLLGCLLLFGGASVITVIPEPSHFTYSTAIEEVLNGSAKEYYNALEQRAELYKSGEMDVVVEPLPETPSLLYFSDITYDPEDWENKGVCRFYGINTVKMKID